ncbi:MAG: hypothetical protein AAFY07_08350 [Pseudomonadota bacterium]
MPFTPYHLGPGLLAKAVLRDRFSFMVFGGAQVLMDVEVLVRMYRGDAMLHGPSHTVLGAFVIACIAGAIGRPISLFVLRLFHIPHVTFGWGVSFATAFIATFSHIALDAVIHIHMTPLSPLAQSNPLLGVVTGAQLYQFCIATGILGAVILAVGAVRRSIEGPS